MKTLIVGVMVVLAMGASQATGQSLTPTEKKAAAGEKIKQDVTPEETANCILEQRSALRMIETKLGMFDKTIKFPTAEMEKASNRVIEEFKKSACFHVLQIAGKKIEEDFEFSIQVAKLVSGQIDENFTRRVDAIKKQAAAGEKIRQLVWDDKSNKYIPKEEADAKWKASNWCKGARYMLNDIAATVKKTEHGNSYVDTMSEMKACKVVAEDMQQRYGNIIFNLTQILPSKDYVQKTRGISYATLCRNFSGNLARMSHDDIATFFFIFYSSYGEDFETGDEPYFSLSPDFTLLSPAELTSGNLMRNIAEIIANKEDKPGKIFWIKFKLNMLLDMLKGNDIQKYTRSKRGEAILKSFKKGCVDK